MVTVSGAELALRGSVTTRENTRTAGWSPAARVGAVKPGETVEAPVRVTGVPEVWVQA